MTSPSRTTRERKAAKAEQLRIWADGREAKADQAYEGVRSITDRIPFGQPILVGHHSERGARADQRRIENGMDRFCEHNSKAGEMRSKAANIEAQAARAIYSDDDDATEQLAAKVAALEARRDRIKAYNRTCKAGKDHGDLSLLSVGQKRDLMTCIRVQGYQCKNGKFPPYVLTNLGSEIRRNAKRLEELRKPETGRWLTAKFASDCRRCAETVDQGDRALYFRRTREIECETCAGQESDRV